MMKNYLLNLLQQCSKENFGQDAIEWAVNSGMARLTSDLDSDVRESMSRYDEIIEGYRAWLAKEAQRPAPRRAPMERAVSQRRIKAGDTATSAKKGVA